MATILSKAELAYELGKVHNHLLKIEKVLDTCNMLNADASRAIMFLMQMCEKEIIGIGGKE